MQELNEQAKRGEKLSIKRAAITAGYSESYADTGQITRTASWKKLLETALPDDKLLDAHLEGLQAFNTIYATTEGEISDTMEVPDFQARFRYLDSGYKLKGKYEPTEHKITERRSLDEVDDEIAEALSEIAEII